MTLNQDIIGIIFKYLVKCCECLKYTTIKNSDFCDNGNFTCSFTTR